MIEINNVVREDIEVILNDKNIMWEKFRNKFVLITGVTGLIGSNIAKTFSYADEKYKLNTIILGTGRNEQKGKALASNYNINFIKHDACNSFSEIEIFKNVDYIIHCAAMTKSYDMLNSPVDVIDTSLCGTKNMLELAYEADCESVVYLSSMEVYGEIYSDNSDFVETTEKDLGYINLDNPRSSYPESKRMSEMLCTAYNKQYNVPVKVARLALTFGADTYKNLDDTRVINQFIRKVFSGENIEMHTLGKSMINCCYIVDAIRGILTILLNGENSEAYNIANPSASQTIRELAEYIVTEMSDNELKVVVNIPDNNYGYASDTKLKLNVDKLLELNWKPKYDLCQMLQRIAINESIY